LNQWDVNHDEENVDHPSVLSQSKYKTLQQENHTYVGDDHHDENVGHNQSFQTQSYSLVNKNHMSDDLVHERNETKHEKKYEVGNQ
jgi:hypothetical protein